ncbi:hypothetical protein NMY22_g7486 [Coprinellus aureogranulatus]|nr:hypothetical protein NMY22_g7486 [Coprinellus aureogranulatus]
MPPLTAPSADPALTMAYILNSMPPSIFISRLHTALDPTMGHTTTEFTAFLDALKGLGLERAVHQAECVVLEDAEADRRVPGRGAERHCVRCHKGYRESENGVGACVITSPALFGFAIGLRNASKHTTDARQADKTRGEVVLKTCAEEWCSRKIKGPAKAILPATMPVANPNASSVVPVSSQTTGLTSSTPPVYSIPFGTPSTAGAPNQASKKEAKVNGGNPPAPQMTAEQGAIGMS